MTISPDTLEALHRLPNQDASLLQNLYAAQSLEQAADIVSDSARRLRIAIDRGELITYLQRSTVTPG